MKTIIAIFALLGAVSLSADDQVAKFRFSGPLIVDGNEEIDDLKVYRVAALKDGEYYVDADLAAAAERVCQEYRRRNYFNAKVDYKVIDIGEGEANVSMVITEGARQKAIEYTFDGAEHIDAQELRKLVEPASWWNPFGWFADDPMSDSYGAKCRDRVTTAYHNLGYRDVRVTGPQKVTGANGQVAMVFTIKEGEVAKAEVEKKKSDAEVVKTEVVMAEEKKAEAEEKKAEVAKVEVKKPVAKPVVKPELPKLPEVLVSEVKFRALDGFGGDVSAVVGRCQTQVGRGYDPMLVTRDVTSLKNSGEFEEISADAQRTAAGVEVTFFVKRKVRFTAPLVVQGNDELSESKIAKESGLQDGYLYGEADLAAAAAKVRLAYQKKYYSDAKVVYKTDLIGGNDVTVTFVVDEGQRQKVAEYQFEGAAHAVDVSYWRSMWPSFKLADDQIDEDELHTAIDDLPWWNPMGWFTDSPVTVDQRAQCCDKLATVYRNHGYLDVQVAEPEVVPMPDGKVNLVFKIDEGVQYRIGESSVKGLTRYPEAAVKEKSELPAAGALASEKELNDAAHRIEVTVGSGDSGLADTRVVVKRIPTDNASVVNVVYQVTEGVPVVINEVKIRGNDYTKDKVIRREIALGPGDRMLADRAERSQKRLENLDYFSRVRHYLEPTDKGKDANGAEYRDLVYEVEEKNTGSFMVGVGASTVDSVYLSAELSQNNFDLFAPSKWFRGAGQKGRVYVAWGPRYQSAEVGIVEPHLFDRMLELSVDAYRRLRWYDEYDLIRSGAQASLTYPVKFWPTWEAFGRLGIGLSGEYIEFDDTEDGWYTYKGENKQWFREEEREYGDTFEPVVHFFWVKDSRNNFRIPTSGHRTKLFLDVDPAGDNQYWRLGVNHRSYFDVWKRFDHVFMVGLRAETIDGISDDVPIYNRMFLGGPRSIRGIEYRNVAPMIKETYGGDYAPWGGQTLFCMNFEYTIPIVKMLRMAVFSDLGSVGEDTFDTDFSDTFAWTVGIGFRLDIPMFPIRLDFATPIEEPDEADKEVFSFLIGYDF